jgi:hypothetical protein
VLATIAKRLGIKRVIFKTAIRTFLTKENLDTSKILQVFLWKNI